MGKLWSLRGSKPWPPACKTGALANWAKAPRAFYYELSARYVTISMEPYRWWEKQISRANGFVAVLTRLELATSAVTGQRSNQLSYSTKISWRPRVYNFYIFMQIYFLHLYFISSITKPHGHSLVSVAYIFVLRGNHSRVRYRRRVVSPWENREL